MSKIKDITKLPVSDNFDGTFILVNDKGSAKQIASDRIRCDDFWEEIANTKIEGDSGSFFFEKDKNNLPFQLKKAMLFFRLRPNTSNTTGWINVEVGDGINIFRATNLPSGFQNETENSYISARLEIECTDIETKAVGFRSTNSTSAKDNFANWGGLQSTLTSNSIPLKCMKALRIFCNGNSLGAGTEIYLYGVRL